MIWPFKRKKVLTVAEYAATQPMPPCGKQETHWQWQLEDGIGCPACAGMEFRGEKEADESRTAEKIAAAVVKKMRENP